MKFTTNWRVGFGTPVSRCDIDQMWEGETFADAARSALAGYRDGNGYIVSHVPIAATSSRRDEGGTE